jgi:hypothetical protein
MFGHPANTDIQYMYVKKNNWGIVIEIFFKTGKFILLVSGLTSLRSLGSTWWIACSCQGEVREMSSSGKDLMAS